MAFLRHLIFCSSILTSPTVLAQASQHSGHSGGSGNSDSACIRAKVTNFQPPHLETIIPGGEFSFFVSGSNGPGHIHVTIREKDIPVQVESKDTFYVVKGKLPIELSNETVRISVLAKAKNGKCDFETGWLLKVINK